MPSRKPFEEYLQITSKKASPKGIQNNTNHGPKGRPKQGHQKQTFGVTSFCCLELGKTGKTERETSPAPRVAYLGSLVRPDRTRPAALPGRAAMPRRALPGTPSWDAAPQEGDAARGAAPKKGMQHPKKGVQHPKKGVQHLK